MGRPAVFFDRDNTLIVSGGYLADPVDVVLVEGAADAVARVRAMGFAAVVFSNQSGVARGLFTEEAVYAVNGRMDELLHEDNPSATIDRHEFCPFHPQATVPEYRQASELRKPAPGMIFRAAATLDLDLPASWVIGDAPRDVAAGHAAGCRTILLKVPDLPTSPAAEEPITIAPDFVAMSLAEAVDLIEREWKKTVPVVVPATAAANDESAEKPRDGADEGQGPGVPKPEVGAELVPEATTPADVADLARAAAATEAERPEETAPASDTAAAPVSSEQAAVSTPDMNESNDPSHDRHDLGSSTAASDATSHVAASSSNDPAADEPAADEPAADEPAADEPAADEPAATYALPLTVGPKLTWGERMRAAKAQGLLPAKDKPAANDAAADLPHDNSPAPAPAEPESADVPSVLATPPSAEPASAMAPADDSPPPPATPLETAAPPPAGPADESGIPDRDAVVSGPRTALPADADEHPRGIAPELQPAAGRPPADLKELESLVAQALTELKRANDPVSDFALGKLMAGVVFILSLFLLGYAVFTFLRDNKPVTFESLTMLSIAFLMLTITLLVMGRQR